MDNNQIAALITERDHLQVDMEQAAFVGNMQMNEQALERDKLTAERDDLMADFARTVVAQRAKLKKTVADMHAKHDRGNAGWREYLAWSKGKIADVEKERDDLKRRLESADRDYAERAEECTQIALIATERGLELNSLKQRLAEVEAGAGVMRRTLEWLLECRNDSPANLRRIESLLATDAAKAAAERVAKLEAVIRAIIADKSAYWWHKRAWDALEGDDEQD